MLHAETIPCFCVISKQGVYMGSQMPFATVICCIYIPLPAFSLLLYNYLFMCLSLSLILVIYILDRSFLFIWPTSKRVTSLLLFISFYISGIPCGIVSLRPEKTHLESFCSTDLLGTDSVSFCLSEECLYFASIYERCSHWIQYLRMPVFFFQFFKDAIPLSLATIVSGEKLVVIWLHFYGLPFIFNFQQYD